MVLFSRGRKAPKKPDTHNLAGGRAYSLSPQRELLDIALTSKLQRQFYREPDETMRRVRRLVKEAGPEFAARCALYTRHRMGLRSISHLLAAEVSRRASGEQWLSDFYRLVARRPDDMREIIACIMGGPEFGEGVARKSGKGRKRNGHALPNSLKRGFARRFEQFDEYQLGAYRGEGQGVSLVDVMRLVHPRETEAIRKLKDGTLRSQKQDAKLTRSGQEAGNAAEAAELKREVWHAELERMGYNALVMNARGILASAPELKGRLCERIEDAEAVRRSLIQPLQIYRAYRELEDRQLKLSLSRAIDLACANVPRFEGRTLVAFDESGSMTAWTHGDMKIPAIEYASLFAAILAKSQDADVISFDTTARYRKYDLGNTTLSIAEDWHVARGGGTDMGTIFSRMRGKYDRVIVLTDMQSWYGVDPEKAAALYEKRQRRPLRIYSFDLTGYGTALFRPGSIQMLSGVSFGVFDTIARLDQGGDVLMDEVNAVRFTDEWVQSVRDSHGK
ncbi:TROVE domain-containing protein [bacterium]|nr:TROVE domain-containing protein [bacterium]